MNIIPPPKKMNRLWGLHFTTAVVILLFPLSSSTRTSDHTGGSSTSPSVHMLKAEAHFRMHTEEVPRKCWLNTWGKWISWCLAFWQWWIVTPSSCWAWVQKGRTSSCALLSLSMGNLIYFCEFLNIYNPFTEDLLGGICLLWEVKERPRKWFSILSAS